METLGEKPIETPMLDGLLANFKLGGPVKQPIIEWPETEQIKDDLRIIAASGALTREDIESALQQVPEKNCREDQQISILTLLAFLDLRLFIRVTGHNPLE